MVWGMISFPNAMSKEKERIIEEEATKFGIDDARFIYRRMKSSVLASASSPKKRVSLKKSLKYYSHDRFREIVRHELWHLKTWRTRIDTEKYAKIAEKEYIENIIIMLKIKEFLNIVGNKINGVMQWKEYYGKLMLKIPWNSQKSSILSRISSRKLRLTSARRAYIQG